MKHYDVVIIGAGAAGMMCGAEAGRRGRSALVIEHAAKPGQKIRISGGGRCNFTNIHSGPHAFLSANPRFAISALARYTPSDFIALVERYGIAWHEKTLGQFFCDGSAAQIIDMLLAEMAAGGVTLVTGTGVRSVERTATGFALPLDQSRVTCDSLVVATGGKSIPKMGATGLAYALARQFGVPVVEPHPGLVPLRFDEALLDRTKGLSGVAVKGRVHCGRTAFDEALLFTHRGVSGPAVLQISSYWRAGGSVTLDMAPESDTYEILRTARSESGRQAPQTALTAILPKRLAQAIVQWLDLDRPLRTLSDRDLRRVADQVHAWTVWPIGSEGYRTAEVTLGGIDTSALDSQSMQVRTVPGLYFIGEAVDVTGWLGGYNFQWAWSSGWAAGQAV